MDGEGTTPARPEPAALRLLKRVWRIPDVKPPREMPPADVAHDIYKIPDHKQPIPQRRARRRRRGGLGSSF